MGFRRDGKSSVQKNNKTVEKIFQAKRERRKKLARLSIEEKVKILVQMQKLALPILLERGLKKKAWNL